jgi:hypothetical protein
LKGDALLVALAINNPFLFFLLSLLLTVFLPLT